MSCYYTGAGNGSLCYELYDKERLAPDREVINAAAEEIVNLNGQKVDYYINTFTPLCADNTYGEQPTSVYIGPRQIKIVIELSESSLAMSKFGFNADDDVTGYFSINGFTKTMSGEIAYDRLQQEVAPKAGDVFQMKEYGNDRPGNRAGNYFQVTERRDQDVSSGMMNPLGGHYVWRIKAKRLEYSFEPGLSGETGNDQVYDDTFSGILTSHYSDDVYDYVPAHLSLQNLAPVVQTFIAEHITLTASDFIGDNNDVVIGGDF